MFSDASRFHKIARNSPDSTRSSRSNSESHSSDPDLDRRGPPEEDTSARRRDAPSPVALPVCSSYTGYGSAHSSPTHSRSSLRSSPVHFNFSHSSSAHSSLSHSSPAHSNHTQRSVMKKAPPLRSSKYANSVLYGASIDGSPGSPGSSRHQQRQRADQRQPQHGQRTKLQLDPKVLLESSSQHAPPLIYVESCLLGEFEAKEEAKLQQKAAAGTTKSPSPRSAKPSPMEGQILKFTNVMKGFQYRWFVLDPDSGMLEYFEKEEHKKQRPRGSVHLAAAVVSPSEEDSQTFIVNAANGEIFKLRASDARERQLWVDRIRSTAEYHTANFAQNNTQRSAPNAVRSKESFRKAKGSHESLHIPKKSPRDEAFQEVREFYMEAEDYSRHLDDKIGALPPSGSYINSLDADLLLLKATSTATLQCIQDCINILQMADVKSNLSPRTVSLTKIENAAKKISSMPSDPNDLLPDPDEEVLDEAVYADKELEGVEEHKSVILHLLSQLKLGMDLTKVVLPTFILERRSLLEMFADYMAHPDAFLKIPSIPDPEGRMLAVLEWYLTSFHVGRQGSIAKKPYNPIIGETFHCSWYVKEKDSEEEDGTRLAYTAEQVSHHPPVSAFYFECPSKKVKMNASIYTKSKFMGMSIGVSMIGKVCLWLEEYGEEYVFGMPSAYARSILTVPWVELGDKVSLTCEKTGYAANIVFHTKPFYGGKLHHFTAEAKNTKGGEVICKAQGEWNGSMELTYPKNPSLNKTVDVSTLTVHRKYVRPIEKQRDHESRKLWQHVTKALRLGDVATATEHKTMLEEIQREGERHRKDTFMEYSAKFFKKIEGNWVNKSLPDNFGLQDQKK